MTDLINFITIKDNEPDPYDFVQLYDKENIIKMQSYCKESIIETAKGRYDVRIQKVKGEKYFTYFAPNKYFLLMLSMINYLLDLALVLALLTPLLGCNYY